MKLNKLLLLSLNCLFCGVLAAGSLQAVDLNARDTGNIAVGERNLSPEEQEAVKSKRALAAKERADLHEQLASDEEEGPSALMKTASDAQKAAIAEKADRSLTKKKAGSKALYYTTHPGAFHHPVAVSLLGESVEFEDGSLWTISSYDRYNVLNWFTSDEIVVTPNSDIFSSYSYRLNNQQTGVSVAANLTLGPIYNGVYTHWIVAIDYLHGQICLDDGSVWKMSVFDTSIVNKWLPNDTIIIGVNNGIFSASNPNILINVNVNNYAIGSCLFY